MTKRSNRLRRINDGSLAEMGLALALTGLVAAVSFLVFADVLSFPDQLLKQPSAKRSRLVGG